jgi:hypothetical protein
MNRRPAAVAIAWLLALVLLRSLVPTGFMPAGEDGRFTLILCEGQGSLPIPAVPMPAAAGHHHHHHEGGSAPSSGHHMGEDCAYAQSAHPALAAAFELPPAPVPMLFAAAPAFASRAPHAALPRYRAARGPPHVA